MVRFLLHRPIAVLITTFALMALGLVTFNQIPVSLLPDIAIPEITVQVSYPNASARELQKSIIKPLRNQLQQVNHLADLEARNPRRFSHYQIAF
ncbi:MAG: efflux RND transporter permease subunit [Arcicella sp.]|nr:efflux RND transporter permease subunit [Arcicella sp.]